MDYWNPHLKTLSREKLRGLELKNFREILRYAKKCSLFYRDTFREVEPEEVTTWDSLKALPLVDKEDLRQVSVGHYFPLCLPLKRKW